MFDSVPLFLRTALFFDIWFAEESLFRIFEGRLPNLKFAQIDAFREWLKILRSKQKKTNQMNYESFIINLIINLFNENLRTKFNPHAVEVILNDVTVIK